MSNMKREKLLLSCTLMISLSACAGNSLAPKNSDKISVKSEPSGASVYVMGEDMGLTPLSVDVDNLYPVTYSPDEQELYGKIVLKHEGCSDKTVKVSTGMVSSGLKTDLDCVKDEEPEVLLHVQPQVPTAKPVKQRLQELQGLKDEGLISEHEYQDIRSRILKSL